MLDSDKGDACMSTLIETLNYIRQRHLQYIEATYHLRHPRLIDERRKLMEEGGVFSDFWVEASPTYEAGPAVANLRLPTPVTTVLQDFAAKDRGLYDPPYPHQATALA